MGSVRSRRTRAKPASSPPGPRRAVKVESAQNREPSLRVRHACSLDRPSAAAAASARGVRSPSWESDRCSTATGRPMTSSPPYPVSRWAPVFQVRIRPAGSSRIRPQSPTPSTRSR
jgi:hypothetical protein